MAAADRTEIRQTSTNVCMYKYVCMYLHACMYGAGVAPDLNVVKFQTPNT